MKPPLVRAGDFAVLPADVLYSSRELRGLKTEKEGLGSHSGDEPVRVLRLDTADNYGFGIYVVFSFMRFSRTGRTHLNNLRPMTDVEALAFTTGALDEREETCSARRGRLDGARHDLHQRGPGR